VVSLFELVLWVEGEEKGEEKVVSIGFVTELDDIGRKRVRIYKVEFFEAFYHGSVDLTPALGPLVRARLSQAATK